MPTKQYGYCKRLFNNYAHKCKGNLCLAFIDGESAYTRPPQDFILETLWHNNIRGTHWLVIGTILGALLGTLKHGRKLFGKWHIRCGVPQGLTLSVCLFVILLVELYDNLVEAGCGISVQ